MRVAPVVILDHAPIAGGATSTVQQLNQAFGYSVQCLFEANSGTIAGTIKLQASLEEAGTYVDVYGGSQDVINDDSVLINVPTSMYPFFRIVFEDSGSGPEPTLTVKIFYRGF